jgi:hypothetical protein
MQMTNQYPDALLSGLSQQASLILDNFLRSQQKYTDFDGLILAQNLSFCLTNGGNNSAPRCLPKTGTEPIFW